MADIVMALYSYVVMADIVMALYSYGRYSYGLVSRVPLGRWFQNSPVPYRYSGDTSTQYE